jgi:hypothetical protein
MWNKSKITSFCREHGYNAQFNGKSRTLHIYEIEGKAIPDGKAKTSVRELRELLSVRTNYNIVFNS